VEAAGVEFESKNLINIVNNINSLSDVPYVFYPILARPSLKSSNSMSEHYTISPGLNRYGGGVVPASHRYCTCPDTKKGFSSPIQ